MEQRRRRGTGSVTRHMDGWRARLPRAFGRRAVGVFTTEAEAHAVLDAAMAELAGQPLPDEAVTTVDEWGLKWLAERAERGETKKRTSERNVSRWKTRVSGTLLGKLALRDVTERDVRAWLDGLRKVDGSRPSESSLRNALSLVRTALEAARVAGELAANPATLVRLTPGQRRRAKAAARDRWTWLTAAEVERVLACDKISVSSRAAYATAIYGGLRAGELWGLRWSDVDFDRGTITVRRSFEDTPKSHAIREVQMLPPLRTWLETWRRAFVAARVYTRHDLVWPARDGAWHADGFDAGWADRHRAAAKIRRGVRLHDLRHTCASHLIQGTWAPTWLERALRLEEVREWLGHESIDVTQRYAHLSRDSIRGLVVLVPGPSPEEEIGTRSGHGGEPPIRLERTTYGLRNGGRTAGSAQETAPTETTSRRVSRLAELGAKAARAIERGDPMRDARALDLIEAVAAWETELRAEDERDLEGHG